jgi:hypothetical protein
MFDLLKKFKSRKLIKLNDLVFRRGVTLEDIKDYTILLNGKIKRTDFIPYDANGNFILNHKPVFKGWSLCTDTSGEVKKVAKMQTKGNSYKIYFDTAAGSTIISLEHMVDECTYNDLVVFFEGNLELN